MSSGNVIMRKLRIYLDTSVINFLFADDAPDFKKATVEFFERGSKEYDLFVSNTVIVEISHDPDADHREALLAALRKYSVAMLVEDKADEVRQLASVYLARGVIPAGKQEDALHVAWAVVHQMDVLLSWNFRHLANLSREARIQAVNMDIGYRYPIRIVSPLVV